MRLPDQVTILRAPQIAGPYNGSTADWVNATESAPQPAAVQPLSSSEDVVLQARTETRWRLFLLPTTDVLTTDRVRWAGNDHEVDGEVERHRIAGRDHHQELVLLRVVGG